jgi:hypothetical protein
MAPQDVRMVVQELPTELGRSSVLIADAFAID